MSNAEPPEREQLVSELEGKIRMMEGEIRGYEGEKADLAEDKKRVVEYYEAVHDLYERLHAFCEQGESNWEWYLSLDDKSIDSLRLSKEDLDAVNRDIKDKLELSHCFKSYHHSLDRTKEKLGTARASEGNLHQYHLKCVDESFRESQEALARYLLGIIGNTKSLEQRSRRLDSPIAAYRALIAQDETTKRELEAFGYSFDGHNGRIIIDSKDITYNLHTDYFCLKNSNN